MNPVGLYQKQKLSDQVALGSAQQKGFKSPQEAAAWERGLEEKKINAPVDVAKIGAQGNIDVQKLKDAGYSDFFEKLMNARIAGIDPGTEIRGPNGMTFKTAQVPSALAGQSEKEISDLTKQLYALEHPAHLFGVPLRIPDSDLAGKIAAKKAEIVAAQSRGRGSNSAGAPAPTQAQSPVPPYVAEGLGHVAPGRHTFSDGSVWMKGADGSITRAQ
jgi:hypothetical protein